MAGSTAPTRLLTTAKWTGYASLERERDGGDPLGFRAAADRVALTLSPALSQASNTTRGFGLLCLGLSLTNQYRTADELMLRFERFHVLAQVKVLHGDAPWPGKLRATRMLIEATKTGKLGLDQPILDDQLSSGLWGTYRRPARLFGLIRPEGAQHNGRPSSTVLTQLGLDLARRTRQRLFGSDTKKIGSWLNQDSVALDTLEAFETVDNSPTDDELEILSKGFRDFDEVHRFPYAGLYDCFLHPSSGAAARLSALDCDRLNAEQAAVVPTGQALRVLINTVEVPYRKWMVNAAGVDLSVNLPSTQIEVWKQLPQATELAMKHLHDCLAKAEKQRHSLFEAADAHQKWLANERGAAPWDRALPDKNWGAAQLPDFGLSAPMSLFAEGIDARPASAAASDGDET